MKCEIYEPSIEQARPMLFHLNSKVAYVYELSFPDIENIPSDLVRILMKQSQSFPLYFYMEMDDSFVERFDALRVQHQITFYKKMKMKNKIIITFEITNSQQFGGIFPLLELLSNMEELVVWSTNKTVFLIKNRYLSRWQGATLQVNLAESQTLCYLPFVGTLLTILSNDVAFSTVEKVQGFLPSEVIVNTR